MGRKRETGRKKKKKEKKKRKRRRREEEAEELSLFAHEIKKYSRGKELAAD